MNKLFNKKPIVGTLPALSSFCPLWGASPSRFCHEGVGFQDFHPFWLYTFVPHRISNPPTHALYALEACMSVPQGLAPQSGQKLLNARSVPTRIIDVSGMLCGI